MMVATPDGKYYAVFWRERDNFNRLRIKEINEVEMKDNCQYDDYVIFRKLTLREHMQSMIF